jgi:hypothetical protein
MIIQILTILAISNLITEQKISRDIINKIFKPENYLLFSGWKRFTYDLLSCWVCSSFHVAWIYLLINQEPLSIHYITTPLITMLVADIIQKFKK